MAHPKTLAFVIGLLAFAATSKAQFNDTIDEEKRGRKFFKVSKVLLDGPRTQDF